MFVTDNVGSVTGIIDYNGSTAATYSYTPYGQITSADSGADTNIVQENLIGYAGGLIGTFTAGSTGYLHDGNRWYDLATGTFTAEWSIHFGVDLPVPLRELCAGMRTPAAALRLVLALGRRRRGHLVVCQDGSPARRLRW
ncbi:MAG TPA: hypothetical protein VG142_01130 [Trebonia sp.]|nr:hypothetical protein [Trebonia sp.]